MKNLKLDKRLIVGAIALASVAVAGLVISYPKIEKAGKERQIESFVNEYFTDAKTGSEGAKFWCFPDMGSRLYAVRDWRILKKVAFKGKDGKWLTTATVQVDSSNKGGQQITTNWGLVFSTNDDKKLCLLSLSEA